MRSVLSRKSEPSRQEKMSEFGAVVPREYVALRTKIDTFSDEVTARRAADLSCRAGCAGCCHVELTVSAVEAAAIVEHLAALPATERARLRPAGNVDPSSVTPPRCAMLRDDDTCAIYPVRPLVCRSQGLPLLYPAELVPEAARRGLAADGRAVTCCPLNFQDAGRPPRREDVLDAERVDVMIGLINRQFADTAGTPSERRYALADLAQEFVE